MDFQQRQRWNAHIFRLGIRDPQQPRQNSVFSTRAPDPAEHARSLLPAFRPLQLVTLQKRSIFGRWCNMSQETETVSNNPETSQNGVDAQKEPSEDTQPSVQEDACILKHRKSPVAEATEDFILNEKNAYSEAATVDDSEPAAPEPATPVNSESSESAIDEQLESTAPQIVEVSFLSETVAVEEPLPPQLNGHAAEEETPVAEPEPPQMNGKSNGECKFQPKIAVNDDDEVETLNGTENEKNQLLNGTIASELVAEDYKLPDVVEVKKNFENIQPAGQNVASAPPKKVSFYVTLQLILKAAKVTCVIHKPAESPDFAPFDSSFYFCLFNVEMSWESAKWKNRFHRVLPENRHFWFHSSADSPKKYHTRASIKRKLLIRNYRVVITVALSMNTYFFDWRN